MAKIAFIGSANALGMMYALELKRAGHNVLYFVTNAASDTLSRPECHFPETPYPYDDWIIERVVKNPLRSAIFTGKYLSDITKVLDDCDFVFLSGLYLMLALHLKKPKLAFLSHGSDLDVWCNKKNYKYHLKNVFGSGDSFGALASIFGISKMRAAFSKCDYLITFPEKLSSERDAVLYDLTKKWSGQIIYRFDVSFSPLNGVVRSAPHDSGKLVLLCAVRCSFVPEAGSSPSDMKGVDSILRGVAQYISFGRLPVELHIVEKGKDLRAAKLLCDELNISDSVVWHKEMPFIELLALYEKSHICFDQVSDSWLGAIGCYALYLGRPLIANSRKDVLGDLWSGVSPVCEARNEFDVANWLVKLEDPLFRSEVGLASINFAENNLGPSRVLKGLMRYVDEAFL
jgi:hypothetical protein